MLSNKNSARRSSSAFLGMLLLCQTLASPVPLDTTKNVIEEPNVFSRNSADIHPRFASAILGGLATTIVGNALGGTVSPLIEKVGMKIGGGGSVQPPANQGSVDEQQTEVPAKKPVAAAPSSKESEEKKSEDDD